METKIRKEGSGKYERKSTKKGTYKIYGLVDPVTQDIMYVGLTKQYLCKRLEYHIYASKKSVCPGPKDAWIKSLLEEGKKPKISLLETLETKDERDAKTIENDYIEKYGTLNKQTNKFESKKESKTTNEQRKILGDKIKEMKESGMKTKEIASALNVSCKRVQSWLVKLGINKRQKLIERAKWIEKLRYDYTDKEIRKMLNITEMQMAILDKRFEEAKWKGNL